MNYDDRQRWMPSLLGVSATFVIGGLSLVQQGASITGTVCLALGICLGAIVGKLR